MRNCNECLCPVVTEWIDKWKNNGWRTVKCEDVKNKEDIKRLDDLCKRIDVKWVCLLDSVLFSCDDPVPITCTDSCSWSCGDSWK